MEILDVMEATIRLGIVTGLIEKWQLDYAIDMKLLLELFSQTDPTTAIKVMLLAHHFPDWNILAKLIGFVNKGWTFDRIIFSVNVRRNEYNTPEIHDNMMKVTSDYEEYGGFDYDDISQGPAAELLDEPDQIYSHVAMIETWLTQSEKSLVDDLLGKILLPGHHGYWLEHLCRWCFFVRTRHFKLPTEDSKVYLSMIGCQLAYKQFFSGPFDVKQIETLFRRFKDKLSYADFGCLLCELYRMDSEFKKSKMDSLKTLSVIAINDDWPQILKSTKFDSNSSARDRTRLAIKYL